MRLGQLLLLFLSVFWLFTAFADNTNPSGDYNQQSIKEIDHATVIVNGDVLFEVIGIRAFPAKLRAKQIADSISVVAADASSDPDMVHAVNKKDRVEVLFGDQHLFYVVDRDAEFQGIDNRVIAAETFTRITRKAIISYRHDRTSSVIKKNIMLALLRTVVLAAALISILWIFRRLDKFIEKIFKHRVKKLEAKSMRILQSKQVWRVVGGVLKLIKAVTILALFYIFLTTVMNLFPWTRYFSRNLLQLVLNPLKAMGTSIIDFLPSLFFLLMLFLVTRYILKLMYGFFDAINRQNLHLSSFESEWAWPTYRIARLMVIIFAVVVAYPYIPGSSSGAFKGISLFLGVLLSLGSTSFISNIIAGYTMTYRRAFKVGDRVCIGETVGQVTEVRLMVTNLTSLKNEKIVMPNSTILNSEVVNYSTLAKEKGLILHTSVGIGYEVPWRQVEAMLLEAAARTTGLMKEPAPFVLQTALTDFAVTYEINAYCKNANKMVMLYSELHRNIQDLFNEHNVQIMTPNYVADTPEPKVVPPSQWYTAPATKLEPE